VTAELPRPILDPARCTGCGDCVAICPAACLEMDVRLPWLPRPGDCIACAACELICPTAAVIVTPATPGGPGW
jgi:NAD-dependent dihydropyrimidine dehydrogenase PreA subunit